MQKNLKQIAHILEGELVGNAEVVIKGISGIKEAQEGEITFLANPKYASFIDTTKASAIITSFEVKSASKPIIRTKDPSVAFVKIASLFSDIKTIHPVGIHPTAIIAKDTTIAQGVAIGAYTVIEEGVSIGKGSVIYGNCYIGHHSTIGENTLIYPHVSVREYISIGRNVIINNGAVIGSDGFGYTTVNGVHERIPQIGTVVVEDNVDIGANVTIDRARFDKTIIGKGTKIDNLVHIAHNVIIGENCLIVAQVGISGSTVLGKNVTLAGQAGLVGHIKIGDNAIVGAQGGVTKSVPENTFVSGYPARPQKEAMKVNACVHNLPKLYDTIKELKKKIEELERK